MSNSYQLFIDFDGTITENDVGYEMFKHFTNSKTEALVEKYRRGEVNSLECLSGECDFWNSCSPAADDVDRFLKVQALRSGCVEFLRYLESKKINPIILSEGFDFYIDKILGNHGLSHLTKITNVAIYSNGKLTPSFPYFNDGCGNCSNCKGYHINKLRPPKSCAIFIGDGHSDHHASQAADIVFARSYLSEIMSQSGHCFIRFQDFADIEKPIEKILSEGIFVLSERLIFKYLSSQHHDSFRKLWEYGDIMKNVGYPNGLGWSDENYRKHFEILQSSDDAIYLAIEDRVGEFMGEAKIAFPDQENYCHHDLKLLPGYWGKGLGFEAWNTILDRARTRWPQAAAAVTPSVDNNRAISLYLKLGFQFSGEIYTWSPSDNHPNAVPIRFRKMIKRQN